MDHAGDDCRVRMPIAENRHQMVGLARSARRDDRNADGVGDHFRDRQFETFASSIRIYRIDNDFPCSKINSAFRPFESVHACKFTETARRDFIAAWAFRAVDGIHAKHDALPSERRRAFGDDVWLADR